MPRNALLIERARAMRREPSPFEHKLWLALRAGRLGGVKFRRQNVIGPYIADFACRIPMMLVIEVDGDTHGSSAAKDAARTRYLESRGYRVVRFSNHDVGSNLEGVLMAIADVLQLPLSPALSPEGERRECA
jgi:very-short-patch-repair endonuclease